MLMFDAFIVIVVAFIIDIIWGDPPNRLHPVVMMGTYIKWVTNKWNHGGNQARLGMGTFSILFGGLLFGLPWLLLPLVLQKLPVWITWLILALLLKPVFAFRGLISAGKEVKNALEQENLIEARRLVGWHLVSRDTSNLSQGQVVSATVESLAENLTDSFLSPLFYFSLGGLPAAWFYRFCNTADAMIGYHTEDYEYFGKFAARLDDILNWLPSRLAGMIIVLSAVICRFNPRRSIQIMASQHNRTSSPNAGWTMAAAAGALGVTLEKEGQYRLEGGDELPVTSDIEKTIQLVTISLFISLFVCGGISLVIQFIF